jgi:hypothetical protein
MAPASTPAARAIKETKLLVAIVNNGICNESVKKS